MVGVPPVGTHWWIDHLLKEGFLDTDGGCLHRTRGREALRAKAFPRPARRFDVPAAVHRGRRSSRDRFGGRRGVAGRHGRHSPPAARRPIIETDRRRLATATLLSSRMPPAVGKSNRRHWLRRRFGSVDLRWPGDLSFDITRGMTNVVGALPDGVTPTRRGKDALIELRADLPTARLVLRQTIKKRLAMVDLCRTQSQPHPPGLAARSRRPASTPQRDLVAPAARHGSGSDHRSWRGGPSRHRTPPLPVVTAGAR